MGLLDFLGGGRPVDRFAKQVVAEMRRREPGAQVKYDPRQVTIFCGDGSGYVGNVFLDWQRSDAAERARIMASYPQMLLGQAGDAEDVSYEDAKPRLRPSIKNLTHVLNQQTPDRTEATRPLNRLLAGPLCLIGVVDSPTSMQQINQDMLDDWAAAFDEVLDIAIDNLRAESPAKFRREPEGFYVSDYRDYFDASRILLPHLFEQLSLKGDPVAIVADRSVLLVAGSEDADALKAMAQTGEATVDNGHRAIAYTPIVLRDGQWQVFAFDAAQFPELERLRIKQQTWDAREQKVAMEIALERDGIDLFVGDLFVHEHEGRAYTFTSLASKSVLPKADVICMPGPGGDGMIPRRWQDVEAVTGEFAVFDGSYPPIYQADLPSEPQLQRLRTEFPTPAPFEGFATDDGWVRISRTSRSPKG